MRLGTSSVPRRVSRTSFCGVRGWVHLCALVLRFWLWSVLRPCGLRRSLTPAVHIPQFCRILIGHQLYVSVKTGMKAVNVERAFDSGEMTKSGRLRVRHSLLPVRPTGEGFAARHHTLRCSPYTQHPVLVGGCYSCSFLRKQPMPACSGSPVFQPSCHCLHCRCSETGRSTER